MSTISTTIGHGVTLSISGTYASPLTITTSGYILAASGDALYGPLTNPWTVENRGTIMAAQENGIALYDGGVIINGASGVATALVSGGLAGVLLEGATGIVANSGTIMMTEAYGFGAEVIGSGTIVNGSSGLVEGATDGVAVRAGVGTVNNAGTILGLGPTAGFAFSGDGVVLGAGGTVSNGGTISGSSEGVAIVGGSASLVNYGTILAQAYTGVLLAGGLYDSLSNYGTIASAQGNGVYLGAGGDLTNGGGGAASALIAGGAEGITSVGAVTIVNYGTIADTGSAGDGVFLGAGGIVRNAAAAVISGPGVGAQLANASGTVVNYGTITGAQFVGIGVENVPGSIINYGMIYCSGNDAVFCRVGGTVSNAAYATILGYDGGVVLPEGYGNIINYGTIADTGTAGDGVFLGTGGVVHNAAAGVISGPGVGVQLANASGVVLNYGNITSAQFAGIGVDGVPGSIVNYGTIYCSGNDAVFCRVGGTVSNAADATILGYDGGVVIPGGYANVVNFGTIEDIASAGNGVVLGAGGTVTNGSNYSGAAMIAGPTGIAVSNANGTVVNYGTIIGSAFDGVFFDAPDSNLVNAGTIVGGGVAVGFNGGDNLLVLDPGASFSGMVNGGGDSSDTIELAVGAATGVLPGLGTDFVGFGAVVFDAGAAWTVEIGKGASFTGVFSGFAAGDTIDLSGIAATAYTYSGGVLTLMRGSAAVAALNLVTVYAHSTFGLMPDGDGGTDITVLPTATHLKPMLASLENGPDPPLSMPATAEGIMWPLQG